MRRVQHTLAGLLLVAIAAGCGSSQFGRRGGDPDIIRRDQVLAGEFGTAYDVVRALHPNWLVRRTSNTSSTATPIWVYVDGSRYGDLSWLRNVRANSIGSIRRIDAITATTRWGTGHSEGVLYVTTYLPTPGASMAR